MICFAWTDSCSQYGRLQHLLLYCTKHTAVPSDQLGVACTSRDLNRDLPKSAGKYFGGSLGCWASEMEGGRGRTSFMRLNSAIAKDKIPRNSSVECRFREKDSTLGLQASTTVGEQITTPGLLAPTTVPVTLLQRGILSIPRCANILGTSRFAPILSKLGGCFPARLLRTCLNTLQIRTVRLLVVRYSFSAF